MLLTQSDQRAETDAVIEQHAIVDEASNEPTVPDAETVQSTVVDAESDRHAIADTVSNQPLVFDSALNRHDVVDAVSEQPAIVDAVSHEPTLVVAESKRFAVSTQSRINILRLMLCSSNLPLSMSNQMNLL